MAWIWDNILGIIAMIVAVYGAVLSTFNTWYNYRRNNPNVGISFEIRCDKDDNPVNNKDCHQPIVIVTVVNKSIVPVSIAKIGFMLEDGTEIPESYLDKIKKDKTHLPKRLEKGEQAIYSTSLVHILGEKEITNDFKVYHNVIPYAEDTEGNTYKGQTMKFPQATKG